MTFDVTPLIGLLRESLPEALGGLTVAFVVGLLGVLYSIRSRRRRSAELSEQAKMLLVEASKDADGIVLRTRDLGGTTIQSNGKQMSEENNPRSEARWEAAIRDLCSLNLLEVRGNKGEVYALTHEGYELADHLKQR